ncbi:MAG: hypothetical protein RSC92_01430 [Clostridia bacterium]
MQDNLSIVITTILLVTLIIFPLYNFFKRQDERHSGCISSESNISYKVGYKF